MNILVSINSISITYTMEFRHLRYFMAVAEEGSFSRAAERLGISQPGLSQQIRQLEAGLGAPLFDRLGRRIRLTGAGRRFVGHASELLRQGARAQQDLAEYLGRETGELRIGAIQSFNSHLLPPLIRVIRARLPAIRFRLMEASAPAIEERLIAGDLDLGLAFSPPDDPRIAGEVLFEEELVGVVDAASRVHPAGAVSLAELASLPLALLDGEMFTRRLLDAAFARAGIVPRPVLEANNIESLLRAVPGSDLCAILPERALQGRDDLRLLRLTDPTPRRPAALLRCRGGWLPGSARVFETVLRAHLAAGGLPARAVVSRE